MTVIDAPELTPEADELEALIEEARTRARRRHLGYAALVLAALSIAGSLYLGFHHGGTAPRPVNNQSWHATAAEVSPKTALRRDPYMGVSCRVPNSFSCNRVGLAVWLREPARQVDASIAGGNLKLDDPGWSRGAKDGEQKMFAGFLQPAGLIDGPLRLTPDYRGDRWIGREPVVAPVRLWIRRDHGAVTTTVHVALSAGWG